MEQLRWDGDGDCAHDFLGPFVFASSNDINSGGNGKADETEEKLMHEQTAAVDDSRGKKARKKG